MCGEVTQVLVLPSTPAVGCSEVNCRVHEYKGGNETFREQVTKPTGTFLLRGLIILQICYCFVTVNVCDFMFLKKLSTV